MSTERSVFYISDGTAITAEVLGHAVLSQFPVNTNSVTLPFVENVQRAQAVKARSMRSTSRAACARWCFSRLSHQRCATSFWRAKVSARTSCRRWWHRCRANWA